MHPLRESLPGAVLAHNASVCASPEAAGGPLVVLGSGTPIDALTDYQLDQLCGDHFTTSREG